MFEAILHLFGQLSSEVHFGITKIYDNPNMKAVFPISALGVVDPLDSR